MSKQEARPDLLDRDRIERAARVIHETRMELCWGKLRHGREPWPEKMPPDFGYVPQPWVDIAWAQAKAVLALLEGQ